MTLADTRTRFLAESTALAIWMSCLGAGAAIAQQGAASADLPTVAAVQGDVSLGIDVASKFLTGCPFSPAISTPPTGASCARSTFHAPSAWSPRQLHVHDRTVDYHRFYLDKTATEADGQRGMDDSPDGGIEGTRILFYAGHGHPDDFMADFFDNPVKLESFSVGDGEVRYLFMMSCNLFAHGPRDLSSPGRDFTHPEKFEPGKVGAGQPWTDDDYMADVFSRWGAHYGTAPALRSPLNPRLRLACGGSSQIGAGLHPTHLFWFYRTIVGLPPADAWLVGLYEPDQYEPLCISRGDSLVTSGLADRRFEKDSLHAELDRPKHVYIEYPVPGDEHEPLDTAAFSRAPTRSPHAQDSTPEEAPLLPVIQVAPAPLPALLRTLSFSDSSPLAHGFRGGPVSALDPSLAQSFAPPGKAVPAPALRAQDLCLRRHQLNGSLVLSWRPPVKDREYSAQEQREVDQAGDALLSGLLGVLPQADPAGTQDDAVRIVPHETLAIQMNIDAVSADEPAGRETPAHTRGCLYQRQSTAVRYQGHDIPILGEGGERFVARCPSAGLRPAPASAGGPPSGVCQRTDAPLVAFVYNDRVVHGTRPSSIQKTAVAAETEAKAQLERLVPASTPYERVHLRWGYRAAPAHCDQQEMYLVYQFEFASKNRAFDGAAPIGIEVPAHDLGGKDRIEDTWTCSPEVAP